jgi:hypothetical protein
MPRERPPAFVTHAHSPELIQPSEGPFDHPSPSPPSAAMFGVALCKKRDDVAGTQTLADCLSVITTVPEYAIRTMAWAPRSPCKDGMASTSARAGYESLRLAAVS